jgi:hypothetical protein
LIISEHTDDNPLLTRINAKLAQFAAATPTPPWSAAWQRLGPESSEQERLAVFQAVRAAGSLPDDAGFYLVAWQIDVLTLGCAEEALREQEDRLEALQRRLGLDEDAVLAPGEGPPEYEEARRQLHDAWEALEAAKMEDFGEHEMARLFRTDRQRFEQRSAAGRPFFHGQGSGDEEDPLDWLDGLLDDVAGCVEADSPMGPLGLRYAEEDGFWEVSVYPTPVELVGGAHDGEVVVPGFHLDLEQLQQLFDSVSAFGWNALGLHGTEGPYVYVEGVYRGRELYLQVLAYAPEDEEPGLKLDATPRRRRPR